MDVGNVVVLAFVWVLSGDLVAWSAVKIAHVESFNVLNTFLTQEMEVFDNLASIWMS